MRKLIFTLKYELQHIFWETTLNSDPIQDLNHKHFFTWVEKFKANKIPQRIKDKWNSISRLGGEMIVVDWLAASSKDISICTLWKKISVDAIKVETQNKIILDYLGGP